MYWGYTGIQKSTIVIGLAIPNLGKKADFITDPS